MDREIRIKVGDAKEAREFLKGSGLMVIVFVAILPFAIMDLKPFPWGFIFFCAVAVSFPTWMNFAMAAAHRRWDCTEIYANKQSLGVCGGQVDSWQLDWAEFGGFQHIKPRPLAFVPHPESAGLEIFDREGRVVGFLPGVLSGPKGLSFQRFELWRAVHKELLRRAPADGFRPPQRSEFGPKNAKRSFAFLVFGLVVASPSFWALDKVLRAWRGGETSEAWVLWLSESYRIGLVLVPLVIGGGLALLNGVLLMLRQFVSDERTSREATTGSLDPTIDDHRLHQILDGGFVSFAPGRTYRYVHQKWMKHQLKQTIQACLFIVVVLSLFFLTLLTLQIQEKRESIWTLPIVGTVVLAIGSGLFLLAKRHWALLSNLDDVIECNDDQLTIHKPSGENFRVSTSGLKPIPIPSFGRFRIKTLRGENLRYVIDPTHLSHG